MQYILQEVYMFIKRFLVNMGLHGKRHNIAEANALQQLKDCGE